MMTSLESVCQLKSSLSPVQIQILVNSERVLQFVSDISHREVCVYVPGRKKGDMVLVARRLPFSRHRQPVDIEESIGTAATVYDEPLVHRVFQSGLSMEGCRETYYGKMEPMQLYPFVDNGGLVMGVIYFLGPVDENRKILTETAFLSLQVPVHKDAEEIYGELSLQDGVFIIDQDGMVSYADDMAVSIMKLQEQPIQLGDNIYHHTHLQGIKQAFETAQASVANVRHGMGIYTRRIIPVLRRGRVFRIIGIISERTELHEKEEEIMLKTSVIKEIHHRVKNNLQTIAGLLRMQMRRVESKEARDALNESLNRIISISLVHEILSHHDEEIIDVSAVAKRLMDLVIHSLVSQECAVTYAFDGDSLMMPSDEATSLSLVLNELITNAILHGFSGRKEGHLDVSVHIEGNAGVIRVCDDGTGFIVPVQVPERRHLGLTIVRTLVEKDLHGTIDFTERIPYGTAITIAFPIHKGSDRYGIPRCHR